MIVIGLLSAATAHISAAATKTGRTTVRDGYNYCCKGVLVIANTIQAHDRAGHGSD